MVLGASPDSAASHRKFKQKNSLPYQLLVDEGHRLADAFGIWKQKSLYGVHYMGVERSTVIIDRAGNVARIFRAVKVPGHVAEVAEAVAGIR